MIPPPPPPHGRSLAAAAAAAISHGAISSEKRRRRRRHRHSPLLSSLSLLLNGLSLLFKAAIECLVSHYARLNRSSVRPAMIVSGGEWKERKCVMPSLPPSNSTRKEGGKGDNPRISDASSSVSILRPNALSLPLSPWPHPILSVHLPRSLLLKSNGTNNTTRRPVGRRRHFPHVQDVQLYLFWGIPPRTRIQRLEFTASMSTRIGREGPLLFISYGNDGK